MYIMNFCNYAQTYSIQYTCSNDLQHRLLQYIAQTPVQTCHVQYICSNISLNMPNSILIYSDKDMR